MLGLWKDSPYLGMISLGQRTLSIGEQTGSSSWCVPLECSGVYSGRNASSRTRVRSRLPPQAAAGLRLVQPEVRRYTARRRRNLPQTLYWRATPACEAIQEEVE